MLRSSHGMSASGYRLGAKSCLSEWPRSATAPLAARSSFSQSDGDFPLVVRFAPKPDVQNYRDLRNLKSVRTSSFPAPGFAVVRQHLRGAADAPPKGFIDLDAANPPAVRPAGPVDQPMRGPSKAPSIPAQPSDQGNFPALPGRE